MAQLMGASIVMAFTSILIGWIIRKRSDMSIFASRLIGLTIMMFIAPALYFLASGTPYFQAFFTYGLGALIAGAIFYFSRSKRQPS
ncbi:hypothetical protein BLJAPNOD_02872 [Ensifer sp. M14]|uniref:hypothetical protein n=1 Tax=Ensifer sp. M14 TaxID=2203782 RepID=UPI000E1D0A85|nr:hypothetical protein [Ensifer sp. M14]RDL51733.1 hypothetical protein BLJAPNOD_02872 [Ensifer sp. M14]